MDKQEQMAELRAEAVARVPDKTLVWGEGSPDARLMMVGEAPGAQEERLGRPFVGFAGQLLNPELARAGIRREDIYITPMVKYRTTRATPRGLANRTPTLLEVSDWLGIALREIQIISPAVILCLGSIAASALIHRPFAMAKEHGRWFDGPFGIRTTATFHPAYVRRFATPRNQVLSGFRNDLALALHAADHRI